MRILLDTHCWLWLQIDPSRFTEETLAILESPENGLFLSAASSWEIAIKYRLGKLLLPEPPAEYVPSRLRVHGISALDVTHTHAIGIADLPSHHRDPFDLLIASQAMSENLVLLTADPHFKSFALEILWAG